ncbi:hypothetical protein M193_gp006 [Halorubrum tailed phage 7]|uniref:Uncharacterized protein n=1 Tax=Halorubrum sodomense tailed virus 2 TaxID=1262527 RepID=L7TJY6_9CAUD|nr:hypothetical protein HSTV2_6 [Halorubrum sodomense tailed virus 2]YP_008059990.1 hypothetical protein M193_gp006 [Halorubrum tailed phage 7]UBF22154.1 hypothetical protein HRTV-2_gp6 [Halorubrum virus HRTV-2]UBF22263.1 hypothetical protein HRTV-11_gp6 [Halorubrum virus HRTV-11]UBF22373.1 hypothetical protein HCTV-6_gp6 [Haloarcula virus HCTV-6]UBF22480.1 hypothetical protein HCTV-15_gp6 [Haloarcula virus HCTV-15]AGC34275.1 hypothetical protein HSTV2_6 [Halorubrum sodomense tailed virus 2]
MKEQITQLLDDFGEVQVYMDSGAAFEVHRDVNLGADAIDFEDPDGETFVLPYEAVEYVSAHRSHRVREA